MVTVKIEKEVFCCGDCPYLNFNSQYTGYHDSGWSCSHEDGYPQIYRYPEDRVNILREIHATCPLLI